MIAASHLSRHFGSKTVVDDVSFEVGRSEIVALLGPNGAGKTTTLRMLAGLIAPTSGTVTIGGVTMSGDTGAGLRRHIGFLTESPGLWDRLTVRENLAIYGRLYRVAPLDRRIDRLLEVFELSEHAGARAAELSKGMRQKVAIARALLHDPQVLLFDEPTSGLDPEMARTVRHLLDERRNAGCAILVSTHNLDEAERLADRVAVLRHTLVAFDRPSALRQMRTGRLIVRTLGEAAPWLDVARRLDLSAIANGSTLTLAPTHDGTGTAAVVRTLVEAGADLVEVRAESPALEDVYLSLIGEAGEPAS